VTENLRENFLIFILYEGENHSLIAATVFKLHGFEVGSLGKVRVNFQQKIFQHFSLFEIKVKFFSDKTIVYREKCFK
jgi:hypothetical protein